MSRVPNYPPKATVIRTIQDHIAARLVVTSFCSAGTGHSHVVELNKLAVELGPDQPIDHAFKVGRRCPLCGAAGGGLMIHQGE